MKRISVFVVVQFITKSMLNTFLAFGASFLRDRRGATTNASFLDNTLRRQIHHPEVVSLTGRIRFIAESGTFTSTRR